MLSYMELNCPDSSSGVQEQSAPIMGVRAGPPPKKILYYINMNFLLSRYSFTSLLDLVQLRAIDATFGHR